MVSKLNIWYKKTTNKTRNILQLADSFSNVININVYNIIFPGEKEDLKIRNHESVGETSSKLSIYGTQLVSAANRKRLEEHEIDIKLQEMYLALKQQFEEMSNPPRRVEYSYLNIPDINYICYKLIIIITLL